MPGYESDLTKFMREFLEQHPEEVESQRTGRAIWWDKKPQDLAARRKMDEGRVPQTPYAYPDE